MLFNSWSFALFFAVVFVLYYLLPQRTRWIMMLAASCGFYAFLDARLLILLFGVTLVTYLCGLWMGSARCAGMRKLAFATGIGAPLAALFCFKYLNFAIRSLNTLFSLLPGAAQLASIDILLPVGISFYTFKALSYVIDVYRETIPVERHPGYYALYVSFFPQLLAGPIERPGMLLPQLRETHAFDYAGVTYGLKQMAWGYFKKIAIADALAIYVNRIYDQVTEYRGATLILATVLFAIQIYCDFSGYSDIAIGATRMLGFTGIQNFNAPYFARSIREFWRRWHISLSTWFTDYIYIPLGGSRVSRPRLYRNLFLTFLVSGLWHGASWTFVIWGALHGAYMIVGRMTKPLRSRAYAALRLNEDGRLARVWQTLVMFALVCFAWIFFRANSLADAAHVATHLHNAILAPGYNLMRARNDLMPVTLRGLWLLLPLALLTAFDAASLKGDVIKRIGEWKPLWRWMVYVAFVVLLILYAPDTTTTSQFIYFRF